MTQSIVFGTDGIRGHADDYPFTDQAIGILGKAIAQWALTKYAVERPKVLIGCDTRISCDRIKAALTRGLLQFPITIIDAGVIPTPAVCQLIKQDESFNFGIVISASHNVYSDNGIKLFDAQNCKLSVSDERVITDNFSILASEEHDQADKYTVLEQDASNYVFWLQASEWYQNRIETFFTPNFLHGLTIVVDCAQGATYQIAPKIFRSFGAHVITRATQPTGTNINENCGALHPDLLARDVVDNQADIGFAFDGDGDRVIAVNKHGQCKDGDDMLVLLMQLSEWQNIDCLVGTVMTNQGIEELLTNQEKKLIRTKVGDKYVAEQLEELDLPLGGESSGHIIIRSYLKTGDGIFVALKVLESIILTQNWNLETFKKYPQVIINVPVKQKKNLVQPPFISIIEQHEQMLGSGRLLVRYSGTENLLRVMTEALELEVAQSVGEKLADKLQAALTADL